LSVIDVAKQEDEDYIEGRLQTAKSIANKYAALDLSSSGLANDLIGKLTEVVDDNVKNAVLSTRVYRAEKSVWDKKKVEKPDEYSEDNYQYAMRGANAWLNDGQTGSKYNGGGGFIAYDNYDKRLQDNIHNIAKELKATWMVQENGVGMFIDNVTKEAVDRGRLDAALDVFIGKSGREQMQRESWNRSRFVDEEQLKAQYNAKFSRELEEADHYVTNLKALREKEKNPKKRDEYDAALQAWEQKKGTTVSTPYDAVGKEGAFYSLYVNDFKGKYLDAYSYGPLTIKREVDQNHVKTIEFQEKVREFELNYDLKEKELKIKEDKAMREAGIDPATGQPITGLIPGENAEMEYGDADIKLGEYELREFNKAKVALNAAVPGLGESGLVQLAEVVADEDISSTQVKYYEIDGKRVKLDFSKPEVRNAMLNFQKKAVSLTPEMRQAEEGFRGVKDEMAKKIFREMATNPEFNSDFPQFQKTIVGDGKGGYKVVNTDYDAYSAILSKVNSNGGGMKGYEKLNMGEKLSLDMYIYSHMLMDPSIDRSQKRIMFNKMRRDITSKAGWEVFRQMPQKFENYANAATTIGGANVLSGSASGYIVSPYTGTGTGRISGDRAFLSNLGTWDSETSGGTVASILDENLNLAQRNLDAQLSETTMVPSNRTLEVTPSDYRSKALKSSLGLSSNKDNITIKFVIGKDGKPTGELTYGYYEYDNKLQKKVFRTDPSKRISKEKAEALGFSHTKELKNDYDARFGSESHAFQLGGVGEGLVDPSTKNRAAQRYGTLPMDDPNNINTILEAARATGDQQLVNRITREMDRFHNEPGYFKVDLAGHDETGMYHLDLHVYDGVDRKGKPAFSSEPITKGFSTNEVGNFLYDESLYMKHALFTQYLNSQINNGAANAAIRRSQEQISRMFPQQ
jgi:hypothetical protein